MKFIATILLVVTIPAHALSNGEAAILGAIIGSAITSNQHSHRPPQVPQQVPQYVPQYNQPPIHINSIPYDIHQYCANALYIDGVYDPPRARWWCVRRATLINRQ